MKKKTLSPEEIDFIKLVGLDEHMLEAVQAQMRAEQAKGTLRRRCCSSTKQVASDIAGVPSHSAAVERRSAISIARERTPWLLLFLGGLLFCAQVMHNFEALLQRELELAFFVPLLIGHGGNCGGQAVSTVIRTLGKGGKDVQVTGLRTVATEGAAGLLQGLTLSLVLGPCLHLLMRISFRVSVIVATTLPILSTFATLLGSALPFIVTYFGHDPAVVVGPLMTTTTDTIGLAIYLTIATLYIRALGA
eukprot:CAMPEP_0119305418 /NCGR_PEP_ID=MMETSP1333-20130426/6435_1 /TAXON_ID=418940 /ORGANISM="Scyphosphaera apsteinii, Strain RCC1455" /LENGTH=247 /DNA_ID=CAMNT_0007308505 /DNA_START=22 /DNA_END=765 /DNA_ORIENTATION=+